MTARRKTLGTAAFALVLLAAGGCVRREVDPDTIRFRYWGDTEEVKIVEGMLAEFERDHPGVTVRAERKSPDSSYGDLLLQELAVDGAPDVIFLSTDNFDMLAGSGKLKDLTAYLAAEPGIKEADYYPALTHRFSRDGKLLLLPRDIAPVACVYYDKDLFDAAHLPYPKDSWTWEDLRRDALRLTLRDADGQVQQFGFADDWTLTDAWMLAGGGGALDNYDAPTRFTFAEGGALEGILYRWRLLQRDRVMPGLADVQALGDGMAALFTQKRLAMFHSGLWKTPSFRRGVTFRWDVAPFPRKPGVRPVYFCGGSGYGINAHAANPDLCWKLVAFMAGPEGQRRMAATGLVQPALRALSNSPAFLDGQDPRNKRMLLDCAEHGRTTPAWAPWQDFLRTLWTPKVESIWLKDFKGDPAQVLTEVEHEANARYFPKAR